MEATQMYNSNQRVRADVASSLKFTKGFKQEPTDSPEEYQGLESFDSTAHAARHKHGSQKQIFEGFDKPIVNVRTESVSEHQPFAIVDGVQLSPSQLANFNNSQYK